MYRLQETTGEKVHLPEEKTKQTSVEDNTEHDISTHITPDLMTECISQGNDLWQVLCFLCLGRLSDVKKVMEYIESHGAYSILRLSINNSELIQIAHSTQKIEPR